MNILFPSPSAPEPGGVAPAWLPDGASVYSSFESPQHHWALNSEKTIGDIWVENIDYNEFVPAEDIDAGGFGVQSRRGPVLASAISATIDLSGITVICELTTFEGKLNFQTLDLPATTSELLFTISNGEADRVESTADPSSPLNGAAGITSRCKFGMTFGPTSAKMVKNGGTVYATSFEARDPLPGFFAFMNNVNSVTARLHNIAIYEGILTNAQLQALTAP